MEGLIQVQTDWEEAAMDGVDQIKSEPGEEHRVVIETMIPTDVLSSITIKLEPQLDQIIETNPQALQSQHLVQADSQLFSTYRADMLPRTPDNIDDIDIDEQENVNTTDIKEPFTYYDGSPPKFEKFGKGLTVLEMVRLHFDPYISQFDLSKQPVLVLEKVDKYWPVPKTHVKTEIKEEPIDIVDDPEWDKAAEEEILAANEGFFDSPTEPVMEKPKRKRAKPKSYKVDYESDDPDEPDELDDQSIFDDEDENDPDFDDGRSDESYSPDIFDSESFQSMEDGASDSNTSGMDMSLVKQEIEADSDGSTFSRANGILASSQELKIVEIGGHRVETYGDYSKCPKCEKNIKSTFIIRHIKLHDLPTNVMNCPYENCKTSFTRSNNMYRHLKVVHDDEQPYICVYKNCTERYEASKNLRDHVNKAHRKGVRRELEQMEASNLRFKCEFPGCEREYGKKQHLKEHFRKHTGDMRYACDVCGERFFVHGHMKRHLYSHTGIKPHACRWKCGAIFASYGGRMKHERAQHSENPYKLDCDICGRPFRFERELDKHKLTHLAPHERMAYRCSYCGIIFDSISHRERHEQRHKDNDTFQCEDCNKMFKNEKNLRHHYKTHHEQPHPVKEGDVKSEKEDKKEKKEPPKYPCHMCDIPVMFALTALRRHLARKHSTNYKCAKEGCDKTFAKQYQFDAHMKLHMHRSCHMCGKQFKRKQNADIHLMGVHGLTKDDLATLGR